MPACWYFTYNFTDICISLPSSSNRLACSSTRLKFPRRWAGSVWTEKVSTLERRIDCSWYRYIELPKEKPPRYLPRYDEKEVSSERRSRGWRRKWKKGDHWIRSDDRWRVRLTVITADYCEVATPVWLVNLHLRPLWNTVDEGQKPLDFDRSRPGAQLTNNDLVRCSIKRTVRFGFTSPRDCKSDEPLPSHFGRNRWFGKFSTESWIT